MPTAAPHCGSESPSFCNLVEFCHLLHTRPIMEKHIADGAGAV